jgi:hypothetical protein
MTFDWLTWSNPVAVWWVFLVVASAGNVVLWFALQRSLRERARDLRAGLFRAELMIFLCAAYVFGCAFRSVLPRADVQRIALFDTWLSSVLVGRSVATIAEICFVIQWAIVLRQLAGMVRSDTVRNVAGTIVPLIVGAECCSWYAVITTSYLGNTVENSIWAAAFLLIAVALIRLLGEFRGIARIGLGVAIAGIGAYLAFLVAVDVPMYFARWQEDMANGKPLFGLLVGLHDAGTRLTVTHDIAPWRDEMAWMALYFSAAVWSSLALCGFALIEQRLPQYLGARPGFGALPDLSRRAAG